MIDLTRISPTNAYTVAETADLIGIHPGALRNKLNKKDNDPFIRAAQPVNLGKEWIFNGARILDALGTPSSNPPPTPEQKMHMTEGKINPELSNNYE